ncbi:MAG TPA: DUF6502 family protein [Steroidobacteraceae bacterium]|nr:DUF6502 family protein [Steroidobacteraceae bacterium]
MPRRKASGSAQIGSPIVDFLSAFAEFLLAAGIKNQRFSAMMRLAFFQAASASAKLSNERLNQSSVAAMTGLTRLQVRKFARQSHPNLPAKPDQIENVIEGWVGDQKFANRNRSSRRLPISGRGVTFQLLVRKYGGDIPHKAVLREMERHGYVTIRDGHVSLRRAVQKTREEARIDALARALRSLLIGPRGATPTSLRTLNVEVTYPSASDKGRLLLHRRASEQLSALLASIQASGIAASIDSPASKRQAAKVSRTRVMLVTEDLEE